MHKVILDTNFLMIPGQHKVDIFGEIERVLDVPFELCVVEESLHELERIVMSGTQKEKFAAKLGLVLAIQKSLKRLACSKGVSADDEIVKASDKDTFVATQDAALKKRVQKKGARVISLRQKKYLVVT